MASKSSTRDVEQRLGPVGAGVVDEDVEGRGAGNRRLHGGEIGDVEDERLGLLPAGADRLPLPPRSRSPCARRASHARPRRRAPRRRPARCRGRRPSRARACRRGGRRGRRQGPSFSRDWDAAQRCVHACWQPPTSRLAEACGPHQACWRPRATSKGDQPPSSSINRRELRQRTPFMNDLDRLSVHRAFRLRKSSDRRSVVGRYTL